MGVKNASVAHTDEDDAIYFLAAEVLGGTKPFLHSTD